MPTISRIADKPINPDRLREELAGLPLNGTVAWVGHQRVTSREYRPRTVRTLIASTSVNGARTEQWCGPAGSGDAFTFGELEFGITRDLTTAEALDLDARLAAHLHTLLSAEQTRENQDAADLDALISSERQGFIDAVQSLSDIIVAWDGLTTSQRQAATKTGFTACRDALRIVGKVLRVFLRRERGAAI